MFIFYPCWFFIVHFLPALGFLYCSFLARVGKKRTKEAPHKVERSSEEKTQQSRYFLRYDILPLMYPPLACLIVMSHLSNLKFLKLFIGFLLNSKLSNCSHTLVLTR